MPKILVLYYSRTGNTTKMANAVAEGAKTILGVEVSLQQIIFDLKVEMLINFDAILVGLQHIIITCLTISKDFSRKPQPRMLTCEEKLAQLSDHSGGVEKHLR